MSEAAVSGQEFTVGAQTAPATTVPDPAPWWQGGGLPAGPQLGVIAVVSVALALVVVGVLWMDRETYRVVYHGLADRDAAAVVSALEAANIPMRIDDTSGNIEVPANQVHAARFKLAAQGLPQGTGFGFEFLQDSAQIGSSQFMDKARYRHALENELARSIASIGTVHSARVHLAMQPKSAFVREQIPPAASVILRLHPGRSLDEGQIAAITHMVASGVPAMAADRISIVDQLGRLLSRRKDQSGSGLNLDKLEYTRRIESDYVQRIEQLLAPLVGVGRLRAEASADLDFTVIERTEERFDDENRALRSEQVNRNEPRATAAGVAEGVPGALTNQPAAADAEQAIDTVGALADDSAGQTRWTRNFELDKSISHTRVPVGRLRRLSVAVVIDDAITVNADGTKDRKPYSEEEIGRLTQLVKDAVGFDADRGDAVNVFNSAFQDSEVLPPVPWWQQGWMLSVGKLAVGGLLVLMVLLMVVRPLIKALTRSLEVKEKKPRTGPALLDTGANEGPEAIGQMDFDTLSLSGGEDTLPDLDIAPNYQADIRLARRVAASDPRRAAHVVKKWLEDGR